MRRTWSPFKLMLFLVHAFILILSKGNLCGLLDLVEKLLNQFSTLEEMTGEQRGRKLCGILYQYVHSYAEKHALHGEKKKKNI